ncbi:MAG: hypothetical protein ACRERY_17785, partial [Pseudomonas sp.]
LKDWPALPAFACPALLVDIESGPIRLGRAVQLAAELSADYRHIDELETSGATRRPSGCPGAINHTLQEPRGAVGCR